MEFHVLHGTREQCKESKQFLLRGFHPLWPNFPDRSNTDHLCNSFGLKQQSTHCPTTPRCNACKLSHRHGLGSSPFAHHYLGNHYYFLFLRVMRCFSSPRPLKQTMYSSEYCTKVQGCPIRKSTDQRMFAPPRSLSQLTTPFFGRQCQGIRHTPFIS